MKDKEILEKVFDKICKETTVPTITGFNELDNILIGTEKGSLIVIGARPAMGKTSLMMSILENLLKQNQKCLYINLDLSNEMFIKRLLTQYAELDAQHVKTHNLNEKEWEQLSQAMNEISNSNLYIADDYTLSIDEIEHSIKKYNPQYVFVDYLQLIYTNSEKRRGDELSNILVKLKSIAKENNILIFISSQLSRALERRPDKRPMLCDLRETGYIEEIADIVMFIYRDEYYSAYKKDENYILNKGRAEIIIAKNKFGPVYYLNLLFRSSIPKFYQTLITNEVF